MSASRPWHTVQKLSTLEAICFLGKGEDATGGRNRNSVVSDAMEAVIGAIYLDGGFASAKRVYSQVHFK
mgnify:CR=1 FL=1